jgi:hypothetical protein
MTEAQLLRELDRVLKKAPRAGVMPTKVVKSKKAYSRKRKHKGKEIQ